MKNIWQEDLPASTIARIKWNHPDYKSGNFFKKADSYYGLVEIKMKSGLGT